MKKKEWKVDENGRRWFRHPNSDTVWVPVTRNYSEEVVRERKKCTLDELIGMGMIGTLQYKAAGLLSLQSKGLTDEVWEDVASIWEIADVAWAAKRNGRSLSQTKAAQKRREIEQLERMYKSRR
jgi:hypothetical protein